MARTLAWVDHAWCRAEVEEGYHVGGVLVRLWDCPFALLVVKLTPSMCLGIYVGDADAIDDALQGIQQSEEAQVSEDVLDILQTQREQQQRAASANQEVSPSYTRDLLPVFSY